MLKLKKLMIGGNLGRLTLRLKARRKVERKSKNVWREIISLGNVFS